MGLQFEDFGVLDAAICPDPGLLRPPPATNPGLPPGRRSFSHWGLRAREQAGFVQPRQKASQWRGLWRGWGQMEGAGRSPRATASARPQFMYVVRTVSLEGCSLSDRSASGLGHPGSAMSRPWRRGGAEAWRSGSAAAHLTGFRGHSHDCNHGTPATTAAKWEQPTTNSDEGSHARGPGPLPPEDSVSRSRDMFRLCSWLCWSSLFRGYPMGLTGSSVFNATLAGAQGVRPSCLLPSVHLDMHLSGHG